MILSNIPEDNQSIPESTQNILGNAEVTQGIPESTKVKQGIQESTKVKQESIRVKQGKQGKRVFDASTVLYNYDYALSDKSVIRVQVRVFNGGTFYDLRLWGRDRYENLYPKKWKGVCMAREHWIEALKLFTANGLLFDPTANIELEGHK